MGVELHITRQKPWDESDTNPITAEEWMAFVEADPELEINSEYGAYFAIWSGKSAYDQPWIDWFEGSLSTKWPDSALYIKMLEIANKLNAYVQDDEGKIYTKRGEWEFDPNKERGHF